MRRLFRGWPAVTLAALLLAGSAGCDSEPTSPTAAPAPRDEDPRKGAKRVQVGPNVVLEVQEGNRRVLIESSVCLTKGQLEVLLCRKQTKEHESILSADVDARDIHKALLLTGAKAGSPVVFEPKYRPATGEVIKVTLEYESKGKKISVPAQQWIRSGKNKAALTDNWVFAGSKLVQNPLDNNKPFYLANEGDLICISNFETAMLDLPVQSSKDNSALSFECNTELIPPLDTKVTVILEPVFPAKKPDAKK